METSVPRNIFFHSLIIYSNRNQERLIEAGTVIDNTCKSQLTKHVSKYNVGTVNTVDT